MVSGGEATQPAHPSIPRCRADLRGQEGAPNLGPQQALVVASDEASGKANTQPRY